MPRIPCLSLKGSTLNSLPKSGYDTACPVQTRRFLSSIYSLSLPRMCHWIPEPSQPSPEGSIHSSPITSRAGTRGDSQLTFRLVVPQLGFLPSLFPWPAMSHKLLGHRNKFKHCNPNHFRLATSSRCWMSLSHHKTGTGITPLFPKPSWRFPPLALLSPVLHGISIHVHIHIQATPTQIP